MLYLTEIVARRTDPRVAEQLDALQHAGRLEFLHLSERDALRRRLRARTNKGTDCAVALPRDRTLGDGDILLLDAERAIVVRLDEQQWLRLVARDPATTLQLGYHAGNLHWRVRFEGAHLLVAMTDDRESYVARVRTLFAPGAVEVRDDERRSADT